MNLPHTQRFIQSLNCKATESVQSENICNYFLRLLINKINYVDIFGTVGVRNAHYLSDTKKKSFSFPSPPQLDFCR